MAEKKTAPDGSPIDTEHVQQPSAASNEGDEADPVSGEPIISANFDPGTERTELQDCEDRLLRTQAELDNFRKRSRREIEERAKYASLGLINDLLAVLDNLDRALESASGEEDGGGLLAGVQIVSQQMQQVLEQHHVSKIEAIGQVFDPNLHEAVQMEPSEEYPANVVSRELRVGYRLHDRVIRPSQVFVSTGAP